MYTIQSSAMEFKNHKVYEYTLAGRPLVIETGKLAGLANGSCLIRYGETAILCCATASVRPRDGIDFLPLSVDFDERMYAAGKIPGGYLKREGKPSEKAVLTSRVIDRPVRPLFPKDLRNDVRPPSWGRKRAFRYSFSRVTPIYSVGVSARSYRSCIL